MDGILLVDKPSGMTSHDVVLQLRRMLPGARIGHTGTLDPNATGLLIGLVGRATKISRFMMGLDKEYLFTIELGVETDTHDTWGQVVSTGSTLGVDAERILDAASRFRGRYQQIAPSVSAIKHQGTPLYKLAREGRVTPIKTRVVEIREFQVTDISLPQVAFRVVDVDDASRRLRDAGVRLLYDAPRRGTAGTRINFVHPQDAGGVLIELVEPPADPH